MQSPTVVNNSSNPFSGMQVVASPIDQLRLISTLSAGTSIAFTLVSDSVLEHFDALSPEDRAEALVMWVMIQKVEGDLSLSLQDILNAFSAIRKRCDASTETLSEISSYQAARNPDQLLKMGIERYNQASKKNPISLKMDWMEVVTHQAKNETEIENRIVDYFEAISRDVSKKYLMPSSHLVDMLLATTLKEAGTVNTSNLYSAINRLKQHPLATKPMKDTIQAYLNFDEPLALAELRHNGHGENATKRQESAMTALSPNLFPASGREGRNEPLRDFDVKNRSGNAQQTIFHFNRFVLLASQWHSISDGHLTWKDWGRLSQTCKSLKVEFYQRMKGKLSVLGQSALKQKSDDQMALVFRPPENRVLPHVPINKKGIEYIQKKLHINCGPNMLIAIKKGQLTLEVARELLQEKRSDLRDQFHYLDDKQYLVLQKYVVDKIFIAEELAERMQEAIRHLFTLLQDSQLQYYIDQIALESNEPVQPLKNFGFFYAISLAWVQAQLDTGVRNSVQLLPLNEQCYPILCNKELSTLIEKKLITVDQILVLARLNVEQLKKLVENKRNPLDVTQIFKLHSTGQELLCDRKMCSFILSKHIAIHAFMDLNEVSQQRLHAHWDVLASLMDSNYEIYTLKKLVEVIMSDANFRVLSDPTIKPLIVDGKLPIETFLKLSDTDKNRLCDSDSFKVFFSVANMMEISDFFKLPVLNQQFLASYWSVLLSSINDEKLTLDQIKKSTSDDLAIFESSGEEKYIAHINQKYPREDCTIS